MFRGGQVNKYAKYTDVIFILGTPLKVGCDFFISSFGSVDAVNMVC